MHLGYGFVTGVLVALGFPPVSIWPLCFIGFVVFALGLLQPFKAETLPSKTVARGLFLQFYSYTFFVNILGFYWVAYTFHEFGNLNWLVAGFLCVLAFALLSIPSGIFGLIWHQIGKRVETLEMRALALVPFLILWDWIDFRVFPWTPAMGAGADPLLLSSVFYLHTWGWRIFFFAASVWIAWNFVRTQRKFTTHFWLRGVLPTVTFLVAIYGLGYKARNDLKAKYPARQPVALLQGNVGNYEKKLTKLGVAPTIRNVMNIHQDLIEKVAISYADEAEKENNEIWTAWPETSFPGWPISDFKSDLQLRDWARLTRGLHLVGGYESGKIPFGNGQKDVDFNIVALYQEKVGLVDHYQKRIRLAFGEYIPLDTYFPWLYDVMPAVNHFGKGDKFVPLAHPDPTGPVFIPLICYEILYEGFVSDFVALAHQKYPGRELVIINATNDSWYGPTSELFEHSLMARWAMVSQGLPGLRPTNTGLSQVIAPWGEVMASVKRNESLVVFGELPVEHVQKRFK